MTAGSTSATYTATYSTQRYLTTGVSPAGAGTIAPASGWYINGGTPCVQAWANPGYHFGYFSGAVTGTASYQCFTISGPATVTANFIADPPPTVAGPRRIGVKSTGSYWGAGGEQIDVRSGNLNYSIPLIQAKARGGLGLSLSLSYNSQMWKGTASGSELLGRDMGYGIGWILQAGSLRPGAAGGWVFTDGTGAEYALDMAAGVIWTSREGNFATYDEYASKLYFPDGSWWLMNVLAGATEPDAGTRYPSLMQDSNGNQIKISYGAAAGTGTPNTSGRILKISDVRVSETVGSYVFLYNTDTVPHLTEIINNTLSGENYLFGYDTAALQSPFDAYSAGTRTRLRSVTVRYLNVVHGLQYAAATGELNQATAPGGGILQWDYRSYTYEGGLTYREVAYRRSTLR